MHLDHQGMNFIAGLLLLFHQPEDAFWHLCSIIEHLLPNQFDTDMLPAVVDKLVFSHLVQQHFPELARHLDALAVDVSYLCPHWFLCCFVNALPMETCLRVWDTLFWERKPDILFKVRTVARTPSEMGCLGGVGIGGFLFTGQRHCVWNDW